MTDLARFEELARAATPGIRKRCANECAALKGGTEPMTPITDIAREVGARIVAIDQCQHFALDGPQLTAFADRIRADERERCAVICDELAPRWVDGSDQYGRPCPARILATHRDCAAAIRSAPIGHDLDSGR